MKPTQVSCSEGSFNQIPPWTEMTGDIRLTPFYDIYDCMKKVEGYVKELNDDITQLPTRGPCSKYDISLDEGDFRGELELTFDGVPFKGIACNLDSPAFKKLDEATKEVIGESKPYSICGSLPLVGDLQEAGFDVQICGYGHSSVYHGDNEYCTLSVMEKAFKILCALLNKFNQ